MNSLFELYSPSGNKISSDVDQCQKRVTWLNLCDWSTQPANSQQNRWALSVVLNTNSAFISFRSAQQAASCVSAHAHATQRWTTFFWVVPQRPSHAKTTTKVFIAVNTSVSVRNGVWDSFMLSHTRDILCSD